MWRVENHSEKDLEVSVTFCFQNGQGEQRDRAAGMWSEPFTDSDRQVSGVMLHQHFNAMKCVYGISALHKVGLRALC